ncbi:hypothetical protein [Subtercola sp. YIM 133946]|uniref:hypothetical protein n=1 Tax=Subtercola sp. YIM 133946 TaxID=3118909 RepID=UPI002F9267C2
MEVTQCLISDCAVEAASEFTVNDNGLFTVYAVCRLHLEVIRNGAMFPEPAEPTRGLMGIRQP